MKIIIPGGSGQVGMILSRAFAAEGHEVVILSRLAVSPTSSASRPSSTSDKNTSVRTLTWDARTPGDWTREIDGADVVINLAGRSVNCRYSPENRRIIKESRVDSTRIVGQAISAAKNPPPVWLQASTATIYAHRFDAPNTESNGILGGDEPGVPDTWRFSIDVARSWEAAANSVETPRTRKVLLRSAMVMSPDRGGIFATLLGLVRFRLGGKAGNGRQYVSWIHDRDFVHSIKRLIADPQFTGPVNLAAPEPLPYAEFMRILRKSYGVRLGLPATKWMLEIGTFLMRTETELVLKSRRVVPERLLNAGFEFEYPTWETAAVDLCERYRNPKETI